MAPANSSFGLELPKNFFPQIFLTHGWLNLQMQNPWIWRTNHMPKYLKWLKLQLIAIFFFLLIYISVTNMHSFDNDKKLMKDEQTFLRWKT